MNINLLAVIAAATLLSGFSGTSFADPAIGPTSVANSVREARMVAAELNLALRAAAGSTPTDPVAARPADGPSPANHNEDNARARLTANPL
ncbi:hypothetical protein [Paraburkholderia sp. D1E]|uniref:hypothetical protein n=1 Tax=Paraburkholderia sp. D1E TaxID=3461398 RepID=UPI0040465230